MYFLQLEPSVMLKILLQFYKKCAVNHQSEMMAPRQGSWFTKIHLSLFRLNIMRALPSVNDSRLSWYIPPLWRFPTIIDGSFSEAIAIYFNHRKYIKWAQNEMKIKCIRAM